MKGWGTDESAIIEVLGKRTDDQRQRIATAYKQAYGKVLLDILIIYLRKGILDMLIKFLRKGTIRHIN